MAGAGATAAMPGSMERERAIQRGVRLLARLPMDTLERAVDRLDREQAECENTRAHGEEPQATQTVGQAAFDRQPFGLSWPTAAEELTLDNIADAMAYQSWDPDQRAAGEVVREAITLAAKTILRHVPRSPRRTLALQHLISARMDANAVISFRGRF